MKRGIKKCAIMEIRDATRKSAAVKKSPAIKKENVKENARRRDADVRTKDIGENMEIMKEDIMRRATEELIMEQDMEMIITDLGMMVIMAATMMGDMTINMA